MEPAGPSSLTIGLDLAIECTGGKLVLVNSHRLRAVTRSDSFRDVIDKVLEDTSTKGEAEATAVLGLADNAAVWTALWSVVEKGHQAHISSDMMVPVLKLASKYKMSDVLHSCEQLLVCGLLSSGLYPRPEQLHCLPEHIPWYGTLLSTSSHEAVVASMQFLSMLNELGLYAAYYIAFSFWVHDVQRRPQHVLEIVQQSEGVPTVTKDLMFWGVKALEASYISKAQQLSP